MADISATDSRSIRQLSDVDASHASSILLDAGAWSAAHHAPLWSTTEVSSDACQTWARDGVLYGGFDRDELAAVFCVHDVDTL